LANTLLTISMITREALRVLENNLTFTKYVRRDFDDSFGRAGAKIGTVLNIRKPARYAGRVGQGLSIEDATETQVPLVLSTQRGVDIAFTSQDLALSVDDFSDRFIRPAVANVANNIDYDGLQQYLNVYNLIGTPGTIPNALLTYLQAGQRLDEEAAPRDNLRAMIISPAMQATIVDTLKGLFQSAVDIQTQYESGKMGLAIGFKWSMDQNVGVLVQGAYAGTPAYVLAGSTANAFVTSGFTGGATWTLAKGTVFTIGSGATGVYAVNPQNKQSTGALREFVVTAATPNNAGNNPTLPVYPSVITSGPFQNVNAAPTNGALINIQGAASVSSPQGLAFHKDAFALGSADLPLPGGVDMAARVSDKQLGFSMRLVRAYDINTDRFPTRIDILYGWSTLYPELACRVAS
jgi:P22 coat protein - gene protein 5